MSESNDSVESNLVQVGGLELQHFVNARSIDFVRSFRDFFRGVISPSETSTDQLLAVLVEQIKSWQMSTRRDLY